MPRWQKQVGSFGSHFSQTRELDVDALEHRIFGQANGNVLFTKNAYFGNEAVAVHQQSMRTRLNLAVGDLHDTNLSIAGSSLISVVDHQLPLVSNAAACPVSYPTCMHVAEVGTQISGYPIRRDGVPLDAIGLLYQ
ncbi:hypothetical protein F4811DRAFT_552068 [Daldinia bambusicola]|nr:hypothetical protein F4811DRAFT_552068 [Daldinia bambusicola]